MVLCDSATHTAKDNRKSTYTNHVCNLVIFFLFVRQEILIYNIYKNYLKFDSVDESLLSPPKNKTDQQKCNKVHIIERNNRD